MNLEFRFAFRYLFARKSHNVINIISAISAAGIAIGSAALVIILSIYNGFDSLVRDSLGNIEPDILVKPAKGKTFVPDSPAFDWAYSCPDVLNMSSVLEENVFIMYEGRSGVLKAKGVDKVYEEESPIRDHIKDGSFSLHKGDIPQAVIGAGVAYKMGINPRFVAPVEIYFPARDRALSVVNPAASIEMVKVYPSGIFSINADIDSGLMIVPIEKMRELLGYTDEVSGIEIRITPESGAAGLSAVIQGLRERLSDEYRVEDRFMQNESLYKMMRYEKAAIFMILIFIIIIMAFSIFGCLSMLIIEKKEDIFTLRSLGAKDRTVNGIFITEGWLITIIGLVAGIAVGIGVVLLQRHFGFIRMPSGFASAIYPVILEWKDVAATVISIAIIGLVMAIIPVRMNIGRQNR